jgi:hypothetical protein
MIEILYPTNAIPVPRSDPISFAELQKLVGGIVECVHIHENGQVVQVICNEEGNKLRLPLNRQANVRFAGKVNMGGGAVGVYVVLSGKDKLT